MYKKFFNWPKNTSLNTKIFYPKNLIELKKKINNENFIPYGNGKSYNDGALNRKRLISIKYFNQIINFDYKKGLLNVEAGAILSDILPKIVERGWFIPTTPGTKNISLGGMVANNVHGKNIIKNSIKSYIKSIKLLLPNKKIIECSPNKRSDIFYLTVGGFGLTGIILSVEIKLKKINSNLIEQKITEFKTYNQLLKLSNTNKNYEYNAFWINDFNNNRISGLSFYGKHKKKKENEIKFTYSIKKMNLFIYLLLKLKFNISLFNSISNFIYLKYCSFFYKKNCTLNDFFYPQDKFSDWNIAYGKKGSITVQFISREKDFKSVMGEISNFFKLNNLFSSFVIIKKMNENEKYLNFSGTGFSISIDFKIDKKYKILVNFFNNLIKRYKLKVNLSKDLITNYDNIKHYRKFNLFKKKVIKLNNKKISSLFSNRIKIT